MTYILVFTMSFFDITWNVQLWYRVIDLTTSVKGYERILNSNWI